MNKKILSSILISITFAISIIIASKVNKEIIPTSSIPISTHCIILDAGHGQPDRTEQ